MYQVVSDNDCYEQPLVPMIEADLEVLYSKGSLPYSISTISTDHLRQFMTDSDVGFFLELRFSHDEMHFSNALLKWHAHLPQADLDQFPDLVELVMSEFRNGRLLEQLPVSKLQAYAQRWGLSLWLTIQAYKVMSRDLHGHYQEAINQLIVCFYLSELSTQRTHQS